jgi:hypothetical protein
MYNARAPASPPAPAPPTASAQLRDDLQGLTLDEFYFDSYQRETFAMHEVVLEMLLTYDRSVLTPGIICAQHQISRRTSTTLACRVNDVDRHGAGIPIEAFQVHVAVLRLAAQQALPLQTAGHAIGDTEE